MKRINLYLSDNQINLLKVLTDDGSNISEHIRIAINQYLVNKEKRIFSNSPAKKGGGKNAQH